MEEATELASNSKINIKVKTLTNEVYELTVTPEIRVIELKKQIEDVTQLSIADHAHSYQQAATDF